MFMEELVIKLSDCNYVLESARDRKFVVSIARRAQRGDPLTSKQGWAFLAVLRKNPIHRELGLTKDAMQEMLRKPQWKHPLVPSVELRSEVRHLGDNLLGFRTSRSGTDVELAAMKAVYSHDMHIVTISNKARLDAVINFIGAWGFQMDEEVEKFLATAMDHVKSPTRAIGHGDKLIIDAPNDNAFAQFALHLLGASIL